MPTNRTNEDEDFDDFFEDEDDFIDDTEQDDDDNEEFDVEKLSKSERKRYDKMKEQIEGSVVEALAKGDTKSPLYKGLQRVVASKDRELAETRNALAAVIQNVQQLNEKGGDTEFLQNILKDMLDDDSKKVYEQRLDQFNSSKKQNKTEELLNQLLQQQGQQRFNPQVYPYGQPSQQEDDQIAKYRKDASVKLKSFVKKMGVDPEDKDLDYGDEEEPLLVRMDKLAVSIEKVKNDQDDETIERVRRRGARPNTRTDSGANRTAPSTGKRLIEEGSAMMLDMMRKNR